MSKLHLYRTFDTPEGGWRYTVPETGETIEALGFQTLKSKVAAHMEANDIELPYPFLEWFEDAICRQQPALARLCGPVVDTPPQDGGRLTREAISRFLRTIAKWWTQGKFRLVSQEQAEARAAVCAACPMNQDVSFGCFSCKALLALVGQVIGTRKTAVDKSLNWCSACGCRISLKCWVPKRVLDAAEAGNSTTYHPSCWRNSET